MPKASPTPEQYIAPDLKNVDAMSRMTPDFMRSTDTVPKLETMPDQDVEDCHEEQGLVEECSVGIVGSSTSLY